LQFVKFETHQKQVNSKRKRPSVSAVLRQNADFQIADRQSANFQITKRQNVNFYIVDVKMLTLTLNMYVHIQNAELPTVKM
jgi:hypothetical protein